MCREQGFIEKEFVMNEISKIMLLGIKYNVGINLYSMEFDKNEGTQKELLYPKIKLRSREYPQGILDKFQDYYQLMFYWMKYFLS